MNCAFVGHSHHKITSSSKWFIELLQKQAKIKIFWDDSWKGGKGTSAQELLSYDRVFVWQVEYLAQQLAQVDPSKLVFIPMWDGVANLDQKWWSGLGQTRILSFAWILHERLRHWGMNSYHAQFFPDPSGFQVVEDFSTMRGYLWQRRLEIGWPQVAELSKGLRWDAFNLHLGMDPGCGEIEAPGASECRRFNINVTRFSRDREEALPRLNQANVYFAPRSREGIGMAFLEAMARGQCVVSPDFPTMSEYIDHNISGLLYDLNDLRPLSFQRAQSLGAAARRRIENGYCDWAYDVEHRLSEILFPDLSGVTPPRTRQHAELKRPGNAILRKPNVVPPKVSVAIVVLNAADSFEATLDSVVEQTFENLEIVVVDGGSTDGTVDLIKQNHVLITRWVSEPDNGPYDAMNKAARLATGEYIIYMNSGDFFASREAVTRAFRNAPQNADFVIGHHIYVAADGTEELHRAAEFDETWRCLTGGRLSWKWLSGVPGHQATFTRRKLLVSKGGYSSDFEIAADHEFMYRMKKDGAKFYHCGETLAIYAAGGFSFKRQRDCAQDWWKIARLYGPCRGVDHFFRSKYPPSYEIGPWTFPTLCGHVVRRGSTILKSCRQPAKRLNRRRLNWQRRVFGRRSEQKKSNG
jgi:glycosyltransferase involved in cell wall biosynthesis